MILNSVDGWPSFDSCKTSIQVEASFWFNGRNKGPSLSIKVGAGDLERVTEAELGAWLTAAGFTVTNTRLGKGKGLAGTEDLFICLFADA